MSSAAYPSSLSSRAQMKNVLRLHFLCLSVLATLQPVDHRSLRSRQSARECDPGLWTNLTTCSRSNSRATDPASAATLLPPCRPALSNEARDAVALCLGRAEGGDSRVGLNLRSTCSSSNRRSRPNSCIGTDYSLLDSSKGGILPGKEGKRIIAHQPLRTADAEFIQTSPFVPRRAPPAARPVATIP